MLKFNAMRKIVWEQARPVKVAGKKELRSDGPQKKKPAL
jgi:hypothetical protein